MHCKTCLLPQTQLHLFYVLKSLCLVHYHHRTDLIEDLQKSLHQWGTHEFPYPGLPCQPIHRTSQILGDQSSSRKSDGLGPDFVFWAIPEALCFPTHCFPALPLGLAHISLHGWSHIVYSLWAPTVSCLPSWASPCSTGPIHVLWH